jgi:hypothetical protein
VGLPGNMLSLDFVRAVVIGYNAKNKQWVLGLHLSKTPQENPAFRALVRWETSDETEYVEDVRQAARALAVFMSVPLKVFGEKKQPAKTFDPNRTGATGPLQPHERSMIERAEVRMEARKVATPIDGDGFKLTEEKNGLILRVSKPHSAKQQVETPFYSTVGFSIAKKKVTMLAPTGLLGALLTRPGRDLDFKDIANVEYRYFQVEKPEQVPSEDGKYMEEHVNILHLWSIYLTLKDEQVMLVQTSYVQPGELLQNRLKMMGGDKLTTDSIQGVNYFRQHLQAQESIDSHRETTENAALKIADTIGVNLVKTEVLR